MPYNRVNWADSPATTTAVNAADLNQMDAGIASSLQADGSVTSTAAQNTQVTLSGANKTVLILKATDGKEFHLIIATDGSLVIYNATDAKTLGKWGPSVSYETVYDNGVATTRQVRRFLGTTDPSTYTTVNEGDEWCEV